MKYDRNVVIDKINTLKGKRGTTNYVSNEKIAEYLDVSTTTVKKWLKKKPDYLSEDETGYPDIPFPCIVKLCDLFKCDVEYLIGDIEGKTKEITSVSETIGLSKQSVEFLMRDFPVMEGYKDVLNYLLEEASEDEGDSLLREIVNYYFDGVDEILYRKDPHFEIFDTIFMEGIDDITKHHGYLDYQANFYEGFELFEEALKRTIAEEGVELNEETERNYIIRYRVMFSHYYDLLISKQLRRISLQNQIVKKLDNCINSYGDRYEMEY